MIRVKKITEHRIMHFDLAFIAPVFLGYCLQMGDYFFCGWKNSNVNIGPLADFKEICVDHFQDVESTAYFLSHAHAGTATS